MATLKYWNDSESEWQVVLGTKLSSGAIIANMSVDIPTDYATLQDAIDDLSQYKVAQGVTITLNIESGHSPDSGVSVSRGNYGHFRIASEDAEVTLGGSFDGIFIEAVYATAPSLATLIDMDGRGTYAAHISDNSDFLIEANCGFKNSGGYGIYCRSSRMRGSSVVLTGMTDRTLWATRGATLSLPGADMSNQQGGLYGVYVSRGSMIDITSSTINNCGATSATLKVLRSRVAVIQSTINDSAYDAISATQAAQVGARDCVVQRAGNAAVAAGAGSIVDFTNGDGRDSRIGIYATGASIISANNANLSGATLNGARAEDGSTIHARGADASGAGQDDLYIVYGSYIVAHSATTTAGSPSVADTNVSAFNAIDGSKGIIWA